MARATPDWCSAVCDLRCEPTTRVGVLTRQGSTCWPCASAACERPLADLASRQVKTMTRWLRRRMPLAWRTFWLQEKMRDRTSRARWQPTPFVAHHPGQLPPVSSFGNLPGEAVNQHIPFSRTMRRCRMQVGWPLSTQSGSSGFPIAASHPNQVFSNWTATKLPVATSALRLLLETGLPLT